jgi:hypothetical protein
LYQERKGENKMTKEELQRDLDQERGMYQELRKKHDELLSHAEEK